ncbi:DUF1453 domain-containing protein [Streptomyces cinnamoneus]|uniref:DUF1453 domain-containing protein n=1 Tax=Streptomyces cinnamoneus TaxID=53446 RepID=A0A2G1XA33_STRCJ|nr:DUF1453 domain-containing protein [Streptomyces cinnamoneus]PHQ48071.1 DUF1453 domain-containing protein [Streptomyces cinnamoneus]PPT15697.1 DUF1453 domain-containing protein [Streptomyces cinnamoneus]
MNVWLLAGLIAVAAVAVIAKRLGGEPLNVRDLFAPAVVLTALGGWSVYRAHDLTGGDLAWAVAGVALGLALGALRGRTVHVFEKQGVLWQRYTGRTFLVIALSVPVMGGFALLAASMGMHEQARPVQLSIGVGFLGEALVIGRRGLVSGIPFAPDRR